MEDSGVDLDLLDEFLSGTDFDYSDFQQTSTSTSLAPFSPSNFLPVDAGRPVFSAVQSSTQVGYQPDKIWQTQPNDPKSTVKQRLNHALRYIKESHKDGDVLVQVWMPVTRGGKQVLTTCGLPFFLDFNCQRLVNYRSASTRYQFLADEDSHQAVGLPGRVFLWKLPEWSPDVRFFSSYEYHRVKDAQQYDVRGTIALPIFEKDNQSCLGVVELVMTTQKVNYSSDIEKICNAFQAVDLRTSEVFSVPRLKMTGDSYRAALSEIRMVLQTACKTHRLPLAQTWISCLQQGKKGNWHSDETFMDCISSVDDACYVQDPSMKDFQQACSEHHLFRGQGIVGKAFMTNQPCFSSNITDFSKIEYPLSHHAKLFNLRAAVAIRLRCVHAGNADFVLEFFLPVDCIGSEVQKLMLSSLSITIQQVSRTLRVVATEELEEETVSENNEKNIPSAILSDKSVSEIDPKPFVDRMKSQEGLSKYLFPASTQGKPMKKEFERFRVTRHLTDAVMPTEKVMPEFTQLCDDSHDDYTVSFSAETSVLNAEKATEKRRTKTEKTVNLQELQKYFAGSLKDAAKSLGVCPTTLKRICRQHGISRWPSRKIKKVGHSLKKLQVVLDSVHGPAGGIQFTSLYENFIKTTWSDNNLTVENTFSPSKQYDHPESSNVNEVVEGGFTSRTSGSNSLSSSSCSQNSSSSQGCSIEQKQCMHIAHELAFVEDTLADKNQSGIHKEAQSHKELHLPTEQAPPDSFARTESQELQIDHGSSGNKSFWPLHRRDLLKVKAICGEEKVIFRLHPAWGFLDLKQEIMRRFGIADTTSVDIKYLDDDSEWILITCDDDLKECIDVYKLTNANTIKLSAHHVTPSTTTRSSWGSSVLS